MSYIPMRRIKTKSIDMNQSKTIHDLPAMQRRRTLAFNRLTKILEVAKLAEKDEQQIDKFLAYFSDAVRHAARFEEAHDDILSVIDPTTEEAEDQIRSDWDDIYFEILTVHRRLTTTTAEVYKPVDISFQKPEVGVKVKLPKINLPTFSGNIKTWPEYYDIFQSLIHENSSLSDTERMHYLVSSLAGDAAAVIRVFPATGKYYSEAYNALVSRYKDKRELAFTCWKEMQNLSMQSSNAYDFRRVLDQFNENMAILKRLDLPVEHWDFILCYLLLSKLDSKIRCEFEQEYPDNELPTYTTLKTFLYAKCEALVRDTHFSSTDKSITECPAYPNTKLISTRQPTTSAFLSNTETAPMNSSSAIITMTKCTYCGENHSITYCAAFSKKSIDDRVEHAKSHRWCFNCLKTSHGLRDCKSIFKCLKCRQRHHTLLHPDENSSASVAVAGVNEDDLNKQNNESENVKVVLTNLGEQSLVLLSTAIIEVKDSENQFQKLRALIDSGSQAHFITERAAASLGLKHTGSPRKVSGLGQSTSAVSGNVTLNIGINGEIIFNVEALTLPNICGNMPSIKLNTKTWNHVQHLPLADPECYLPGAIDILLGAEIFASMLLSGVIKGGPHSPSALNTIFGWVLTGNVEGTHSHNIETRSFLLSNDCVETRLDGELKRVWELDNIPSFTKLTPDEELGEDRYATKHSRDDSSGRYTNTLPFKSERSELPGSREVALKQFHALERCFIKDSNLRQQLNDFTHDYIDNGQMTKVPIEDTIPEAKWQHVPAEDNPDDLTSRGTLPGELMRSLLWWAGPAWLAQSEEHWPKQTYKGDIPLAKTEERITTSIVSDTTHLWDELLDKFSSNRKSQRILSYCMRFINNMQINASVDRWIINTLDARKLYEALLVYVQRAQKIHFADTLPKQIRKLNPYIDRGGILRVSGRLSHSSLEFEHTHPALLPRDSRLSYLIIETTHWENCHVRMNTVQNLITQLFWILSVLEIQVKPVKSKLYRILGDHAVTSEELSTLFIQIEALFNLWPLYPLNSESNDLNMLKPDHFILQHLTAVSDKDRINLKLNHLSHWQLLQRFQQDFGKRWKVEYLQSLILRAKWTKSCQPLTTAAVVLLKNENTIPMHWPLVRVFQLHHDLDGVRVATVRTAKALVFKSDRDSRLSLTLLFPE